MQAFSDPLHQGLTPPVRVDPRGECGPTKAQAAGERWRRTSRGLYVPADVDATRPSQRIVEAAAVVPEVAGITGWAGLHWCGGRWFDGSSSHGPLPVVIASGYADVRGQRGIEICHERIPLERFTTYDGVPITTPVRSALFQMRRSRSLYDAVVVADMAAADDLVTFFELLAQLREHKTITGVPLARKAASLMVENSWSPMETRMRLSYVLVVGRPTPACNMPLFDLSGRLLGTPDLFDPELGLAMEYDSALHLTTARRGIDIDRETRFRDHGIEVSTIISTDVARGVVADKLHAAAERARSNLRTRRARWTLEQPAWWHPTHAVKARRALATAGLHHLLPSHRYAA